jgi:hypothetical protein
VVASGLPFVLPLAIAAASAADPAGASADAATAGQPRQAILDLPP